MPSGKLLKDCYWYGRCYTHRIWVQNELSYDQFYANKNSLYKIFNRSTGAGYIGTWDITSAPVGKALEKDFPEVKNATPIYWTTERLL